MIDPELGPNAIEVLHVADFGEADARALFERTLASSRCRQCLPPARPLEDATWDAIYEVIADCLN